MNADVTCPDFTFNNRFFFFYYLNKRVTIIFSTFIWLSDVNCSSTEVLKVQGLDDKGN